jgi:CspA family cold shock protein
VTVGEFCDATNDLFHELHVIELDRTDESKSLVAKFPRGLIVSEDPEEPFEIDVVKARHGECLTAVHRLSHELGETTMNGTMVTIRADKGFGFIKGDDGTEYFVHRTAVHGAVFESLREGQAVIFDPGPGDKGPRAENVRLA